MFRLFWLNRPFLKPMRKPFYSIGLVSVLLLLCGTSLGAVPKAHCSADDELSQDVAVGQRSFYESLLEKSPARAAEGSASTAATALSVEQLASLHEPILIDLRSPQDYLRGRIPGSINLQPRMLKRSKAFMASNIVLVAEGYRHSELLDTAEQLTAAGFEKVFVLVGGLSAWIASGNKLEGEASTGARAISVEKLLDNQYPVEWVIIDIASGEPVPDSPSVIQVKPNAAFGSKIDSSLALLAARLGRSSGASVGILLIDKDGGQHARVFDQLPVSVQPFAYYLEGGVAAYHKAVDIQSKAGGGNERSDGNSMVCL